MSNLSASAIAAKQSQEKLQTLKKACESRESFNKNMTLGERERLELLIEECGEVIQIAAKTLRHGYESYHPDEPEVSNRKLLESEINDVLISLKMLSDNDLTDDTIYDSVRNIRIPDKKLQYLHYQLTTSISK